MVQLLATQKATEPQSYSAYSGHSLGQLLFALSAVSLNVHGEVAAPPSQPFVSLFQQAQERTFNLVKFEQQNSESDGNAFRQLLSGLYAQLSSEQVEMEPKIRSLIYKNLWSLYG